MTEPLWRSSATRIEAAALTDFRRAAGLHLGRDLPDYWALHAWSVEEPAAFWAFFAAHARIPLRGSVREVMSRDPMPHTRWFEGAQLNYAQALLEPPGLTSPEAAAIVSVAETGQRRSLSYGELRQEVARAQRALDREGLGPGERVAAYATNTAETVVLLLACASRGVIFSSCSPDFGFEAARARFGQIAPRLLFASAQYRYNGRPYDTRATIAQLAEALPELEGVVLLPYPGEATPTLEGAVTWEAWLEPAGTAASYEALPFDHPLYVLYSSGTTGLPKAIVHGAGGVLLTHAKEQLLHSDIRPNDTVLYFTTCGWMMWNWLVSALARAAAIVLYEGAPTHPGSEVLWRLTEELGITFFGTSARYLHALQAQGYSPRKVADLSSLRTVASTGSPLSPAGFRYVYREIGQDLHLASISGGTDIVGCFMLGVPTEPVYAGQIQAPGLGVDLEVFDDRGQPVRGEPGELVCRQPLPSMPLRFWNDPGDRRYLEAYFDVFPGVWRHGDLIERTAEGGIVVYGRSDATLNPGGVRIGTAEIYRPLEHVPEVVEAVAVGRKEAGDEVIWLFLVLQEGVTLDAPLVQRIRDVIRREASPRHVPKKLFQVPELPRTRSGKAMEIAVARLVNGLEVPNREVIANPEALEAVAAAVRSAGD